jgi:hypothetical protein
MLFWLVAAPVGVLLGLYIIILVHMEEGLYALDPQDAGTGKSKDRGTFEPHSRNYLELAKLVIGLMTLSTASASTLDPR